MYRFAQAGRCEWRRPILLKILILRYWDLTHDIDIENLILRYRYIDLQEAWMTTRLTWVQCDWHLIRCWTDNLGRRTILKKSNQSSYFWEIEILDLDMGRSDGCDGRCPPMASVTKPVEKYQSGLKTSHFNPESVKNDIKNRVLGRGWNDNGIWHFGLCWSLLCQLKWEEL